MKKNIYLIPLFFASISMLLIGCNAHRTNTAETTDGQIALQASEIKEDVFILYTSESNGINNEATGFVDPNKHGFYTSKVNIVLENVSKTKTFSLDQNQYVYKDSKCTLKESSSEEYGDFYCIYDRYSSDGKSLEYLHGTDLVAFYYNPQNVEQKDIVLSEADLKNKAENFLTSFISADELKKYVCEVDTEGDELFPYSVTYRRYIEGYVTDETLLVVINADGTVIGYNGYNIKKYDTLVEKISKEKLDAAKEKLSSKINELGYADLKGPYFRIVTNTSGDVYLEASYFYTQSNGFKNAEKMLLAIK